MAGHVDQVSLVERADEGAADSSSDLISSGRSRSTSVGSAALNACGRPRENVMDRISSFAMCFVLLGLIFAAIGFLYPRDLQRDPEASARENELLDAEYMKLNDALNAIVITGIILIGIGGLILSAIFTNSVVCNECHVQKRHSRDVNLQTTDSMSSQSVTSHENVATKTDADRGQNYGAVSPTETTH